MNNFNVPFDGYILNDAYADLDGYWGPYESISDAFSKIRSSRRKDGKRFGVKTASGEVREYVFLKRTENGQDVWYTAPVSSLSDKDAEFEELVEVEGSEEEVTPALLSKGYKTLVKGIPLQEQITKENTIYEVRDNFNLGEQAVSSYEDSVDDVIINNRRYYRTDSISIPEGKAIFKKDATVEFWKNVNGQFTKITGVGNVLPYSVADSFYFAKSLGSVKTTYTVEKHLVVNVGNQDTTEIETIDGQTFATISIVLNEGNQLVFPESSDYVVITSSDEIDTENIEVFEGEVTYTAPSNGTYRLGKVSSSASTISFKYIVDTSESASVNINDNTAETFDSQKYFKSSTTISYDWGEEMNAIALSVYAPGSASNCSLAMGCYLKLAFKEGYGIANSSLSSVISLDDDNSITISDDTDVEYYVIQKAPDDIRFDYDVSEYLEIPEGCTLKFEGGKVSNGFIAGNSTKLIAPPYHIFDNVEFIGFNLDYYDLRWFGAIEGQDVADAFDLCYRCYAHTLGTPIKMIGSYKLSRTIHCPAGMVIWNGYTNILKRDEFVYPGDGATETFVGELDIKKGITAFLVDWSALASVPHSYDSVVSFSGIRFYCSEILDAWGDNEFDWVEVPETVVLHYKIGGRPSKGFKFENCIFDGFTKSIYVNWGMGTYGSIMSGTLIDMCDFGHSNYGVFIKNEKTTGTYGELTLNNLDMIRCHFHTETKCYLDGLYGANKISFCTFQGTTDPLFIRLKYGVLYLEGLYLEKLNGKIDIIGEHGYKKDYDDFQAIIHLSDWYYPYYSYGKSTRLKVNISYVTVESLPNLFPASGIRLYECTLSDNVIQGRSYGELTSKSFFLKDEEIKDGEGNVIKTVNQSCNVFKTSNFEVFDKYNVKGNTKSSFMWMATFDRTNATLSTKRYGLSLAGFTEEIEETCTALTIIPSATNMTAAKLNQYCYIAFFKSQDQFTLTFLDSGDNILTKVVTPRVAGVAVVKLKNKEMIGVSKIHIKARKNIGVNHFISDIAVSTYTSIDIDLRLLLRLVNSQSKRGAGNLTQLNNAIGTFSDGETSYLFLGSTGETRLDTIVLKKGDRFLNMDGFTAGRRFGTTSERISSSTALSKTLVSQDVGLCYFDKTLGKPLWVKNVDTTTTPTTVTWIGADGTPVNIKRIGTTSQRPTGNQIYEGFVYLDTTLKKPIYAVDISGDVVFWSESVLAAKTIETTGCSLNSVFIENAKYTITVSPPSGQSLPQALAVKVGNTVLTVDTDYTYDSSTGVIVINNVTDNIEITNW